MTDNQGPEQARDSGLREALEKAVPYMPLPWYDDEGPDWTDTIDYLETALISMGSPGAGSTGDPTTLSQGAAHEEPDDSVMQGFRNRHPEAPDLFGAAHEERGLDVERLAAAIYTVGGDDDMTWHDAAAIAAEYARLATPAPSTEEPEDGS